MKKIVGTIAAIALAASSAFAGVNVGMGFNRAIFTPFAMGTNSEPEMVTCVSWGGAPRVGVSFSAAGEQIGVVGDIKLDGNAVNVNDNAYIWVKPASWLKVQLGQSFEDSLRGGQCFGTWDWLRQWGLMTGDDLTFTRLADVRGSMGGDESNALVGAIIALTPIEGLNINVGLKTGTVGDGTDAFPPSYASRSAENVFKNIQVQAGYTIADVAQIKAQWIGMGETGIINAAVALKAVENMNLEVGAFYNTKKDSDVVVAATWGMNFDTVNVKANVKANINQTVALNVGACVGFDLGNGLGLAIDARFAQKFAEDEKAAFGFGAYLDKWLGNGSLGIGFEGVTNASIAGVSGSGDFIMAVPVRVQCFF